MPRNSESVEVSDDTREMMEKERVILPPRNRLSQKLSAAIPGIETHYLIMERLLEMSGKQTNALEIFLKIERTLRYSPSPWEFENKMVGGLAEVFFTNQNIKRWVKKFLPIRLERYRKYK